LSRLRLFLVIALALAVSVGAFLLFSNTLVGEDYLKEFVLQQLEETLGRKIAVHRVKFVIFPRIRVELSQVAIHDPHSDEVMLSAKRIDLVLRLLPLLRKQVVGKRLLVEDPVLTIRRSEAGHWNILDNANQAESDQRTLDMLTRVFMIREATVVNGSVTVIDEARPGGARTLKLERVEGGLMIHPAQAMADVHLSLGQAGQDGLSAVSLVGQIKRVERSATLTSEEPAAPALAEPPPAAPVSVFQFEGQIDAANVVLRDMADFFGPRPVPEQLDGMVNVQGQVRIMPGLAGYDAVLSGMTARLNQLTLTGKGQPRGVAHRATDVFRHLQLIAGHAEGIAQYHSGSVDSPAAPGGLGRAADRRESAGGQCHADRIGDVGSAVVGDGRVSCPRGTSLVGRRSRAH
jgi:hypothetical protein